MSNTDELSTVAATIGGIGMIIISVVATCAVMLCLFCVLVVLMLKRNVILRKFKKNNTTKLDF